MEFVKKKALVHVEIVLYSCVNGFVYHHLEVENIVKDRGVWAEAFDHLVCSKPKLG